MLDELIHSFSEHYIVIMLFALPFHALILMKETLKIRVNRKEKEDNINNKRI